MAILTWDQDGERLYETGVSNGVLYPQTAGAYPVGEAWNGLISVTESPSGAEPTAIYANNGKYLNLISNEELGGTIEAYTYPDGFRACDGSASIATGVYVGQQARKTFGLAYKSLIGNDEDGTSHGYKLHLVYGAVAKPSERANTSVNESPEARTMSWEFSTTPVAVTGKKPTSSIEIVSTEVDATCLAALETKLFGSADSEAYLPLPAEVITTMTPVGGGGGSQNPQTPEEP